MTQQAAGDPYAPLDAANDRVRTTIKWLIASSAAVGAVIIAGTQLSNIGKIDSSWRLFIAFAGVAAAIIGVLLALGWSARLLLSRTVSIEDLAAAWSDTPDTQNLAPVVAYFKAHPRYLQGYKDPAALIEHRKKLATERAELEASLNGRDSGRGRSFFGGTRHQVEIKARIQDLGEQLRILREKAVSVEQMAQYIWMESDFKTLLRKLFWISLLVGAGVVAFTWAAYPPDKPSSADLSGARLIGAYLRDADLHNAKLDNADLTGADLTGANLEGASIAGTIWGNTICPDGTNSDNNGDTCAGHLKK